MRSEYTTTGRQKQIKRGVLLRTRRVPVHEHWPSSADTWNVAHSRAESRVGIVQSRDRFRDSVEFIIVHGSRRLFLFGMSILPL